MRAESAGLLVYRQRNGKLEVLLVHPGGPFWRKRDEGAWSIPKGELAENESGIAVARREFQEELGVPPPDGAPTGLGAVRQAGGKIVHAWAAPGDVDVTGLTSNTFEVEWPPLWLRPIVHGAMLVSGGVAQQLRKLRVRVTRPPPTRRIRARTV